MGASLHFYSIHTRNSEQKPQMLVQKSGGWMLEYVIEQSCFFIHWLALCIHLVRICMSKSRILFPRSSTVPYASISKYIRDRDSCMRIDTRCAIMVIPYNIVVTYCSGVLCCAIGLDNTKPDHFILWKWMVVVGVREVTIYLQLST